MSSYDYGFGIVGIYTWDSHVAIYLRIWQHYDLLQTNVYIHTQTDIHMRTELKVIYSIFNVNHTKCCKVDKCKNYMTKGMNKL